jgi:hypothetical protein
LTRIDIIPQADTAFTGDLVQVALCGDLILHDHNFAQLKALGSATARGSDVADLVAAGLHVALRHVRPLVKMADIGFLNLETVLSEAVSEKLELRAGKFEFAEIGSGNPGYARYSGAPATFVAPGSIAGVLRESGFSVVSTANNHALDQGARGVVHTLERLEANGIVPVGTVRGEGERPACRVLTVKGLRIGFLAFTAFVNRFPYAQNARIANVFTLDEHVITKIKQARDAANVDFLIVSLHWGEEYAQKPSAWQSDLAIKILQAGADLIVGHHPHVLQPPEHVKVGGRDRLALYSLGTLFSHCDTLDTRSSAIAFVGIQRDSRGVCRLRGVKFIPLYVHSYFDLRFDKYIFEPAPIEQLGMPLDSMQLIQDRLGKDNICGLERLAAGRLFEPHAVEAWPSFADILEADVERFGGRMRRALVSYHLEAPVASAKAASCSHGDQLPLQIRERRLVPAVRPFELARALVLPPNRNFHFGCFFVFSGKPASESLTNSLQMALDRYPHFAARVDVDGLAMRFVVDGESYLKVKVLRSKLDLRSVLSQVHCPRFRQAISGDFADITSDHAVCEINIVELEDGWICSTSVQHTVADLLGFWDFLAAWSKARRLGRAEGVVAPEPPAFYQVQGPAPLREWLPASLPPYSWGDFGTGLAAASEIYLRFSARLLREQYAGYDMREIMTMLLARVLAEFAVPEGVARGGFFGLSVGVMVTLRKEMEALRHVVGSPICQINAVFPSSEAVLSADPKHLLDYAHSCIAGGLDVLRSMAGGLGLTARVIEVGSPGMRSDVPKVWALLNLSTLRLDTFAFDEAPVYFSRIRCSAPWEMLVYCTPDQNTLLLQLGLPSYSAPPLVLEFLEGLLPECRREGCARQG